MTSIEWLIEQLQAPCRAIPSHIIEQAKELHKQELEDKRLEGYGEGYAEGLYDGESK